MERSRSSKCTRAQTSDLWAYRSVSCLSLLGVFWSRWVKVRWWLVRRSVCRSILGELGIGEFDSVCSTTSGYDADAGSLRDYRYVPLFQTMMWYWLDNGNLGLHGSVTPPLLYTRLSGWGIHTKPTVRFHSVFLQLNPPWTLLVTFKLIWNSSSSDSRTKILMDHFKSCTRSMAVKNSRRSSSLISMDTRALSPLGLGMALRITCNWCVCLTFAFSCVWLIEDGWRIFMENCGLWIILFYHSVSHRSLIVWIVSTSVKRYVAASCPHSFIYWSFVIKFGRPLVSIPFDTCHDAAELVSTVVWYLVRSPKWHCRVAANIPSCYRLAVRDLWVIFKCRC